MNALYVIAAKVLQETRKTRPAVLLFFFVLILLLTLPFALKNDGTLKGQIQMLLSYGFLLISLSLYLNSLLLSALSFTKELETKQFYGIDTKPVYRFQFFLGKFFGVAFVNFLLLFVMGSVVLLLLVYTKETRGTENERADLEEKIFTSYRGCLPFQDKDKLTRLIEQEYARMKAENRLPANTSDEEIRTNLRSRLSQQLQLIPHGYERTWYFRNLPEIDPQQKLKLRYKLFASEGAGGFSLYKVHWQIGRDYTFQDTVKSGEFFEITFPASLLDKDNTVEVHFFQKEEKAGIVYFPIEDGIELFYPVGSLYANYAKLLFLLYLLSCLLVMLSLAASTFLSFPVAVFLGLVFLFLGLVAQFLIEIAPMMTEDTLSTTVELSWKNFLPWLFFFFGKAYHFILQGSFYIIPNFSYYTPTEDLSLGRVLEWSLLGEGFLKLTLIRTSLLGLAGCLIFRSREVGKPVL